MNRLNSAHADIFQFEVFIQTVFRPFASQARLLDAAEWPYFIGHDAGIDADHAVFELFGNPPDAAHVARIEIAGKAILRIVRRRDDFFLAAEFRHWRHRAESLFMHDLHRRADIR